MGQFETILSWKNYGKFLWCEKLEIREPVSSPKSDTAWNVSHWNIILWIFIALALAKVYSGQDSGLTNYTGKCIRKSSVESVFCTLC